MPDPSPTSCPSRSCGAHEARPYASAAPGGANTVNATDAIGVADAGGRHRLKKIAILAGVAVAAAVVSVHAPRLAQAAILAGIAILLIGQSPRLRSWVGIRTDWATQDPHALSPRAITEQGRLEGIIRSAMEAIITIDDKQTILIFNPMAEKLFACSAMDAIGTSLDRFIPLRYRHAHAQQVRQFGITNTTERQMGRQLPLFGLRATGEEFPIEASISQLVDGNGRLYTVMLRDITDRLRAEAELNASRNELRQLSANIQTAREEEKARIARELHDDLGQRLTALKMDLSLLESELEEVAPIDGQGKGASSWREQTTAMQQLIDDTVHAVRGIAADLRPVMLDDLGLVSAIEWLANEWRTRYGIIVRLKADADAWNVNQDAATAIFRIVQEALTNIARHANATRANIVLSREERVAIVRIDDNGVGLPKSPQKEAHEEDRGDEPARQPFGLIGMRERARLLEGNLTLESPPGGGFVVTVTIPLDKIERAVDKTL